MSGGVPDLTAAEAAARLGIKPESLYAYVSRGLLSRRRDADGSWFDPLEVEEFARRRRPIAGSTRTARAGGHPAGSPLMTIEHDIALLEDDRLSLRGRDAAELADQADFETVCWWLWTRAWEPGRQLAARAEGVTAAQATRATLPRSMSLREQAQTLLPVLAATDPLRHDLTPTSVARMGAEIIAGLVDALPERSPSAGPRLADRLWSRLSSEPAGDEVRSLLDGALVQLVDHDLAASTLAVRAAASARAHPYAVVCCGLGALDSALHGNAGRYAYEMIANRLAGRPATEAVAAAVSTYGRVPGFGHRVYRQSDPRWSYLVGRLRSLDPNAPAVTAVDELVATVRQRITTFPNVDLALAVLAHTFALEPDATELVFAVARTGGWIAHALGEYAEPPLRLRPEGRYVGQ